MVLVEVQVLLSLLGRFLLLLELGYLTRQVIFNALQLIVSGTVLSYRSTSFIFIIDTGSGR